MILQKVFNIRRRGSRRSYREKDTSSSSSSDDVDRRDEASFTKRKEKRMKIERSKLLPLNMDKTDAGMVGTGNFATFVMVKLIVFAQRSSQIRRS